MAEAVRFVTVEIGSISFSIGAIDTCNENLSLYKDVIANYDKAIEIDSVWAEPYNNRGVVKDLLSDYNGALRDYNKAIQILIKSFDASTNLDLSEAYSNRAYVKFELHDYQGATEDYNASILIHADLWNYNMRGKVKAVMGDYKDAIEDYNLSIKDYNHYIPAYINRSSAKYKLDDINGGRNDLGEVYHLSQIHISNTH